jgi:hypothetical protein
VAGPALPEGIDDELAEFVACREEKAVLEPGEVTWLPWPEGVPRVGSPTVRFSDGRRGDVRLRVGYGPLSLRLDARVARGQLEVDVSSWTSFGLGTPIRQWVADLNRHLAANGWRFEAITLDGDCAVLTKRRR